ncbi:MAG: PDZ domain-containing protein [candidate division Zixibacteria bacterium]|nr:PDZ domain-containing protein [candidate division Zixibacteria bacterium]
MIGYITRFAFIIVSAAVLPLSVAASEKLNMLDMLNQEISNIFETVRPSMVVVEADFPYRTKDGSKFTVTGTGIALTKKYIATSATLIEGKNSFRVVTEDEKVMEANLVSKDPVRGVAILEIEKEVLNPIKRGLLENLKQGSYLVVIGNTADIPMAAAVGTFNGIDDIEGKLKIMVNLAVGFSGGAVVNTSGELVGMLTGKSPDFISIETGMLDRLGQQSSPAGQQVLGRLSGDNAQVSLPPPSAVSARSEKDIYAALEQVQEHGKIIYGYLGVNPRNIGNWRRNADENRMVQVVNVANESPAFKAGMQKDDFIVSYNGTPIINTRQLYYLVKTTSPDDTVELAIIQNDSLKTLRVGIGAAEPAFTNANKSPFPNMPSFPSPKIFFQDIISMKRGSKRTPNDSDINHRIDQLNSQMEAIRREIQRLNNEIIEEKDSSD